MALPEDFSNLPSIRFTGINHLSEQTYKADEDALVVQGVPVHQFHGIGDAREKQGRHFRISLYLASSGIGHEFDGIGQTIFYSRDRNLNLIRSSEGGATFLPHSLPDETSYPTLVIETGYTFTWNSVRAKARWRFGVSKCGVKIVLVVRMVKEEHSITLEKWKIVPAPEMPPRPGVTTRAQARERDALAAARCLLSLVHTIAINRKPGAVVDISRHDPESHKFYDVVGGDLRLEFEDLMLQPPVHSGARGHDMKTSKL
ncbi:hypothetical protein ACJZ2D_013245 [Fusarium nematophilum]